MSSVSTVRHDNANVYRGMENQYDQAKDMLGQIKEHREAIENNPDLSKEQKAEMLAQLDQAETAVREALDFTTNSAKWDTNTGSKTGDADMGTVAATLNRAQTAMLEFKMELGEVSAKASPSVDAPPSSSGASGSSGADGASGASDDAKADAQDKAYQANFAGKSPEELANWASSDPQAFYDGLRELSPEDRQATMMMMNQYLQDMNQMFSMMSNMAKAMHDTAKALINNLRV